MKRTILLFGCALCLNCGAVVLNAQTLKKEAVALAGSMFVLFPAGEEPEEPPTTMIMGIRAEYSPVGPGVAVVVRCDVKGDGPSDDDVNAVFADNPKFAEYVQNEVFGEVPIFGKPGAIPVREAKITRSIEGTSNLTERIESEKRVIEVSWTDLDEPFLFNAPARTLGPPFHIAGLMIPAKGLKMSVNGVEVAGTFQQSFDEGGLSIPAAFVLLSSVWIKPAGPLPPRRSE